MGLNLDKPNKWKSDIKKSVDMYNNWFLNFAPEAFRITRKKTILEVADALSKTDYLKNIVPDVLIQYPEILATLRMATCPPIAIDRLIGLANVNSNLVRKIEKQSLPVILQTLTSAARKKLKK
jgi:type II restriction enzyme